MTVTEYKKILDNGYHTLINRDEFNIKRIKNSSFLELSLEDIKKIANGETSELANMFVPRNKNGYLKEIVFYKFKEQYEPDIGDLLDKFNSMCSVEFPDSDDYLVWKELVKQSLFEYGIFKVSNWNEKRDPLFEDFDHLLNHLMSTFLFRLDEELTHPRLFEIIDFLYDIQKNSIKKPLNRSYRNETLDAIMKNYSEMNDDKLLTDEEIEFYKYTLDRLIKFENYDAILEMANRYYEGQLGFPIDYFKYEELMLKAYELKKEARIAAKLGDLYFSGRVNDGIPNNDKGFQFYVISYPNKHNIEVSLKLSDCYRIGIGTFIDKHTAVKILKDTYSYYKDRFYTIEFEEYFIELLLRIAKVYKEGIDEQKDLKFSYEMLLKARRAIHGVNQSAYGRSITRELGEEIYRLTNEVEEELNLHFPDRVVENNGYVINFKPFEELFPNIFIKNPGVEFNKKGNLIINLSYLDYDSTIIPLMGYSENRFSGAYEVSLNIEDKDKKLLSKNKVESISLSSSKIVIYLEGFHHLDYEVGKIIYYPQYFYHLDRKYTVVTFKISGFCREITYINEGKRKFEVGQIIDMHYDCQPVNAEVVRVKEVYEDQLPFSPFFIEKIK